jgi:transposase
LLCLAEDPSSTINTAFLFETRPDAAHGSLSDPIFSDVFCLLEDLSNLAVGDVDSHHPLLTASDLIGACRRRNSSSPITGLSEPSTTNQTARSQSVTKHEHLIVGVDTHSSTHHAVIISNVGAVIGSEEFRANPAGYQSLFAWITKHGTIDRVGVEGTNAYGAGIARHLAGKGIAVVEVPRPDRRTRRSKGKSDPIDAEIAARSVLAGTATTPAKLGNGGIESLRALRIARNGAVKAETAAINQLRSLIITAPEQLRERLRYYTRVELARTCARFRIDKTRLSDPTESTKYAAQSIARRFLQLRDEARTLKRELDTLTAKLAPNTSAVFALGPETTAALLVTIGDNPDRLRTEAAFAHLCGVAPVPASSGKTNRHRLHRGGDRTANRSLHTAVVVRLRYCERTRAYAARRTKEGLSMPEIIRCLKRHIAREVFTAITTDFTALNT